MQKLNVLIAILLLGLGSVKAQDFVEPFTNFVSLKECYVVTNEGDTIVGIMRGVTQSKGYITRLSLTDEFDKVHKFKAEDVKRFAIKPSGFAKGLSALDKITSVRHVLKTRKKDMINREWVFFDAQPKPRSKNKVALLQLLNPGFDQHIKVYDHINGSKSMPIKIKKVKLVGGEERTFWVVKGDSKPEIVRKASFKKSFGKLFSDSSEVVRNADRRPKFKNFAAYIHAYNELKGQSLTAER